MVPVPSDCTVKRVAFASVFVATLASASLAQVCPPMLAELQADGDLVPEATLILRPKVDALSRLQELLNRRGAVFFQIDNIPDGGFPFGIDGFRDAGLRCPNIADPGLCSPAVQCADVIAGGLAQASVRSGLNTGKLSIIFLPDSDGIIDPANPELTDDSLLYVGFDIPNFNPTAPNNIIAHPGADPATIGDPAFKDITWHALDVEIDPATTSLCENGVPDYDGNAVPDFFGVPFDVDSDGRTLVVGRWDPLVPPACKPGTCPFGIAPEDVADGFYRVRMFRCTDPGAGQCVLGVEITCDRLGDIRVVVKGNPCTTTVAVVPESWIHTFPQHGTKDTDLDRDPTDPDEPLPRDVEFLICHVESAVRLVNPALSPVEVRFGLADGGLQTTSDTDGDSAAEDRITANWFVPLPQIEVTKQVRCLEGPDTAFKDHVEALPGARIEYRVCIENTGNVDLTPIKLLDLLDPGVILDVAPLSGTYFPREGGAFPFVGPPGGPGCGFNPAFFLAVGDPRFFLTGVQNGTPTELGCLRGLDVCSGVLKGDRIEFRFTGKVDPAFDACTVKKTDDVLNRITVFVDTNENGLLDPGETADVASDDPATFTPCELSVPSSTCACDADKPAPADDNVASIDVLCRDVSLEKSVRLCLNPADIPGSCGPFVSDPMQLEIPAQFPIAIQYRYVVANKGDVPEKITLTDDLLCCAVATSGPDVAMGPCDLCGVPFMATLEKAGDPMGKDTVTAFCTVVFQSADGLMKFLAADDPGSPCPPCAVTTSSGGRDPAAGAGAAGGLSGPGGSAPPPDGDTIKHKPPAPLYMAQPPHSPKPGGGPSGSLAVPGEAEGGGGADQAPPGSGPTDGPPAGDPTCFTNCARVVATALAPAGVCPSTEVLVRSDDVTVCFRPCEIMVEKFVECVEMPPFDPTCVVDPGLGSIMATPGSKVRYTIRITNVSATIPICELRITDALTPGEPGCIAFVPGSVTAKIGSTPCAGTFASTFKPDGTPYVFVPKDCDPAHACLDPGEVVTITFDALISDAAGDACDPVNKVVVECKGDPDCSGQCVADYCCMAMATALVDVKKPVVACVKEWSILWDSDLDCLPGPGKTPFASTLDLKTGMIIFPAELKLKVTVTNPGDVDLVATAKDDSLGCIVNPSGDPNDGVCFKTGVAQDFGFGPVTGVTKKVAKGGGTAVFEATLVVPTAEEMREFDLCDGAIPDGLFKNTVMVTAHVDCDSPMDVCPGSPATTTCSATIVLPEPCELSVVKDVKCADDPDAAYATSVDALPGSTLTYRIRVKNEAAFVKVPLLCLKDVISKTPGGAFDPACASWVVAGSLAADIAGDDVTACIVGAGFAFNGTEACATFSACRPAAPWLGPQETLTITFDVLVPPTFSAGPGPNCDPPGANPDCANTITATGYEEACKTPLPGPCGANQNPSVHTCTDDGSAQINVVVPKIECLKEVCYTAGAPASVACCDSPTPGDPNCTGFQTSIELDCDTKFPFTLTYRFTVTNVGDAPLTNVLVCDPELVADAKAAGLMFVQCELCDDPAACLMPGDGCAPLADLPKCGDRASAICRLVVPSRNAWLKFTKSDGGLDDPATTARCYKNRAVASADVDVSGLCDFGAAVVTQVASPGCDASVCLDLVCKIDVFKLSRCLDQCVGGVAAGPYKDALTVVAGSAVEYQITVTNVGGEDFNPEVCALKVLDQITADPGAFSVDPATVKIQVQKAGGATCNIVGSGFQPGVETVLVVPSACAPLLPGDKVVITFVGCVASGVMTGRVDNFVGVVGASECPAGVPKFCCPDPVSCCPDPGGDVFCCAQDTLNLNIVKPDVSCTKQWCAIWDSDANCTLDAADIKIPLSDVIDLSCVVFPAEIQLVVTGRNESAVPLSASVSDADLVADIDKPGDGIQFKPGALNEIKTKTFKTLAPMGLPGDSAAWVATLVVSTAADMRALAALDGVADNMYLNTATITAEVDPASGICDGDAVTSTCSAKIIAPPPCTLEVSKTVACIDCDDPLAPPVFQSDPDLLTAVPGACARFVVQVTNTDAADCVRIPRLRIDDDLTAAAKGWVKPGSIRADIDGDADLLTPGEDVTACVAPGFAAGLSSGAAQCYTFGACRPAAPWLAPGETLTITFDIQIPANVGGTTMAVNQVKVDGFTEACQPGKTCQTSIPDCSAPVDDAKVNVLVPSIRCEKAVAADYNDDGSFEVGPAQIILLDNPSYPLRLKFSYTVTNDGQVPLTGVKLCDPVLTGAAKAASVGAVLRQCDLCDDLNCGAVGDSCADLGGLAPGSSKTVSCEVVLTSEAQCLAFFEADGDGNMNKFTNVATATATPMPDPLALCVPMLPAEVTSVCDAMVMKIMCVCPPVVKAFFEVWNENEMKFTTETCFGAWECRPLSLIEGPFGGSVFLKSTLQTDRGRARIDGIKSEAVCGPDSIGAPLLGVAAKIVSFPLIGGEDLAGATLAATGSQTGQFNISGTGPPPPPEEGTPGIVSTAEKGSLLVFPKVRVRLKKPGIPANPSDVLEDTFISLSNDRNKAVKLQVLFVSGSCPCPSIPTDVTLTHDQPIYFSAATGAPAGVAPFPSLDLNSTLIEGYMLVWAINADNQEINWNHLTGNATLVNYSDRSAWEYPAWPFRANAASEGLPLLPPFFQLDLNGTEYDMAPNQLLLEFFAAGTSLKPGKGPVIVDTELTIMSAIQDYSGGP